MWIKVERPDSLRDTEAQQVVDACCEKLKDLYKESKPLRDKIEAIDREMIYWWKLKKQELLKITPIKEIPPFQSGRVREWRATPVDLVSLIAKMSDAQRNELLLKLEQKRDQL